MADSDEPFKDGETIREEQAHEVALGVYSRRMNGEYVSDEEVIGEHVSLMPELYQELVNLRRLTEAMRVAERTGPLDEQIEPITSAAMEEPIESVLFEEEFEDAGDPARPTVAGFQIACQIGQGGQATVYRALHEATNRAVALKVMTGGAWLSNSHRARFDREAAIMASLDHPHIVRIIDRGRTQNGAFFIAMEYVNGWSLEEFSQDCAENDPQHPQLLFQVMAKVAKAIDAAHRTGIVHRDLKPSNIRVDRHHEPRILDFGLASDLNEEDRNITQTGQWLGSVPWCSPEQALHGTGVANAQSDVYALGIILYQSLCGRFPYEVEGPVKDVLNRIASAKPRPLNAEGSPFKFNRDVRAVVSKALAKNPSRRYLTADALAVDLSSLAVHGVAKRSVVVRSWTKAIFAVLIGVAAAAVFILENRSPPPALPGAELPHFNNSAGMQFVSIRAGQVLTNSRSGVSGLPVQNAWTPITVDHAFWLQTTEVTQAVYSKVMGKPVVDERHAMLPMTGVSFEEAATFCRRLSELDHRNYRLPSEIEWEYACRAGKAENVSDLDQFAWTSSNSGGVLHAVASLQPNNFGLYDMLGNAAEWVTALPSQTRPTNLDYTDCHLCRGGAFTTPKNLVRPTWRQSAIRQLSMIGFRVAVDMDHAQPGTNP